MRHERPLFEPRVSIITLGVSDMRRSIGFYRDGLGFPTTAADDANGRYSEPAACDWRSTHASNWLRTSLQALATAARALAASPWPITPAPARPWTKSSAWPNNLAAVSSNRRHWPVGEATAATLQTPTDTRGKSPGATVGNLLTTELCGADLWVNPLRYRRVYAGCVCFSEKT